MRRQADAQILLDTIRANRKALVAVNLALRPEEADKFWPLYERYQKEIGAIGDRVRRSLRTTPRASATFRTTRRWS